MNEIELKELESKLLRSINEDPKLFSLLYDIDMLPEQLKEGSRDWFKMLMIVEAWSLKDTRKNPAHE